MKFLYSDNRFQVKWAGTAQLIHRLTQSSLNFVKNFVCLEQKRRKKVLPLDQAQKNIKHILLRSNTKQTLQITGMHSRNPRVRSLVGVLHSNQNKTKQNKQNKTKQNKTKQTHSGANNCRTNSRRTNSHKRAQSNFWRSSQL